MQVTREDALKVFPASAGMIPGPQPRLRPGLGVPRIRGDDPAVSMGCTCST